MPTASGRGSTFSRASAFPVRAAAAPAAAAPLSRDRREICMALLLALRLLRLGAHLLRRDIARAHHRADDEPGDADCRRGHDAVVGVDRWVRARCSRALHVHRVVERHAEADLLLRAAEAGVADADGPGPRHL